MSQANCAASYGNRPVGLGLVCFKKSPWGVSCSVLSSQSDLQFMGDVAYLEVGKTLGGYCSGPGGYDLCWVPVDPELEWCRCASLDEVQADSASIYDSCDICRAIGSNEDGYPVTMLASGWGGWIVLESDKAYLAASRASLQCCGSTGSDKVVPY